MDQKHVFSGSRVLQWNDIYIYNNYAGLHKEMLNCAILICEHYIYFAKCSKKQLNFIEMLTMSLWHGMNQENNKLQKT